jgi:thiol-disulfide isomerase/thioredoxin
MTVAKWSSLVIACGFAAVGLAPTPARAADTCSPNDASSTSCAAPKSRSNFDPQRLVGTTPTLTGKNVIGAEPFDVTALRGAPVAVVFWLNTCPHCQAVMPDVNKLGEDVSPEAVVVAAAIDAGLRGGKGYQTPAAATKTMRLTIPTVLIPSAAADEWQVAGTPTGFVLDANGVVTAVVVAGTPKAFVTKLRKSLDAASA